MAQGEYEPSEDDSHSETDVPEATTTKKRTRRHRRKSRHAVYRGFPGYCPTVFPYPPLNAVYGYTGTGQVSQIHGDNSLISGAEDNNSYTNGMIMYQRQHNEIVVSELVNGSANIDSFPNLYTWARDKPPVLCDIVPRGGNNV